MADEITEEDFNLKKYKRSPNFITVYTNNVNFAFSPIDVQMICSRTVASMDTEIDAVEEVANLIMTPQHAKAVALALQHNINTYEAKHGEIKMPENPQMPTKEQQVLASAARRKKK